MRTAAAAAVIALCVQGALWAEDACTSLFLRAEDGTRVFATNLDYHFSEGRLFVNKKGVAKSGWTAGTTGAVAGWTSAYGSLTFNLAAYQLVWAGMNEAGLVLSTMALDETSVPPANAAPPLEGAVWLQYLLDTSATVKEALDNALKVRVERTVDHYLLADATGAVAVIEFLDGKMTVHAGAGLPVAALTNTKYRQSVEAWRANRATSNSLTRFITAANGVASFPTKPASDPVDYAFSILARARQPMTVWSIVFDLEKLRVSFFTQSSAERRSIDMKRLDFSCASPVLMMDVNARLSGDVTGRLASYTHQDALQHMKNTFRYFAPLMKEAEIDSFLKFLEFGYAGGKAP